MINKKDIVRVLLVEDNPGDDRLIREYINEFDSSSFSIFSADTLASAKNFLLKNQADIILLDLSLPDSQGLQTYEFLKNDFPLIPMIILTGLDNQDLAVRSMQLGAQDYLVKNQISSDVLVRTIRYSIERKKAEETVRDSENMYRTLFESSQDALMTLEPPMWLFTSGNPSTLSMFRAKSLDEFLSMSPQDLSPDFQPDGRLSGEKAKDMISIAMRDGSCFFEWTHKRIGGEVFQATVLLTRVEHASKKFLQATVRDVTTIKLAERQNQIGFIIQNTLNNILSIAIKDLPVKEMMDSILDCIFRIPILNIESKGAIFLTDKNSEMLILSTYKGLNQALLERCMRLPFGYCLCGKAAYTQKLLFASCVDNQHEVSYEGMKHHGHYCVPIVANGNTLGVLNLYLKEGHVQDPNEVAFLEAIADTLAGIILRKQAEEKIKEKSIQIESQNENLRNINSELEEAKEAAEENNKLKSVFLTNLSHELRTPLNSILGFSQLIAGTDDKQQILDFAKIINKSGNQLFTIIEDLFLISSILSGNISKKIKDTPLNALVDKARFIINDEILKCNNDSLIFSVFENSKIDQVLVRADTAMFGEIIRRLMRNAVKFTTSGKIEIDCQVEGGNSVIFLVRDTGIGIPLEKQNIIFDFFRQVEESSTKEFGGIGSGLAICKSFAEKMDGEITVTSRPGEGSTFYLTLPMAFLQTEERPRPVVTDSDEAEMDLSNKTILIVDDIDSNRLFFEFVLMDNGASVLTADNGKVALDMVKDNISIDLIFMDLNMPVMDGYEATRLIKRIRPEIPIIAQTAYAMDEHENKAYSVGFDAFIRKPINNKELIKRMKECLGKSVSSK